MARQKTTDPYLSVDFWNSGFFSYRNPLFTPWKGIGVSVLQFHDPIIDGANAEDTDKLQWTRRPGFSIYCAQPLPDNEIVNQFMSSRVLDGTVVPWIDTNARWATFSTATITTIVEKTTPNQGYVTTIGNMSYFSDGASADLYKYDTNSLSFWGLAAPTITPTVAGMGFWQANTGLPLGLAILDTNGDVEVISAILNPNGLLNNPTFTENKTFAGSFTSTWSATSTGYGITMGYQVVQQENKTATSFTPASISFDTAVTLDNTIVVIVGQVGENIYPSLSSITDSLGNTYTQQTVTTQTISNVGGFLTFELEIWTAPITTGGVCTLTITPAVSGANMPILIREYAGITGTIATSASQFATNASTFSSGAVSVSGSELVLSAIFESTLGPPTVPSGYTGLVGNTSAGLVLTDAVLGTSTMQNPTWTLELGSDVIGTTAVFPITTLTTGYSPYLFFGSFNLNIPNGAQILGIQIAIPKQNAGGGTVTDQVVKLVIGGSVVGTNEATATAWSTSGYQYTIYGGPTNLWGTTPDAAELNTNGGSGFGVVVSADISDITGGSIVPEIGDVAPIAPTVTIYYRTAEGLGGVGTTGDIEPTWSTLLDGTVNDGAVTWTNYGPILTWAPLTGYPTPVVVLDPNGNLQLSTYVANSGLITAWSAGADYAIGQIVYFGGQYWVSLIVQSASGVVPSVYYATTGSSTTVPYWALTTTPLVTGIIAPVWNTTIGGTTVDGSYTWTNIGQGTGLAFTGYAYVYGYRTIYGHLTTSSPFSANTGAILGPVNATITSFSISSGIVTFNGTNNFVPGNILQVQNLSIGTYLNEEPFTVITAAPSSNFPLTAVQVATNVLEITAINNLVAGQTVTFSGVGTATFLNGLTLTVLSGGLSSSGFTASLTHGNYGPTSDVGNIQVNGSWTANVPPFYIGGDVSLTADSGSALVLITTVTGVGTDSNLCNFYTNVTGVSVSANIVTIYCSNLLQPGVWITVTGLMYASFLNNQQFQVIAVDQQVGTVNTWLQVYFETPNYTLTPEGGGTVTFDAIEIYRTSDGGGTYLFDGAVNNPGANSVWTFDDFVPDADLDILLIAPLSHQNDPPPGAPGSSNTPIGVGTITAYWQGRIWMVVGNYVYFDAGPDCTNGIPEESWPPAYRFQFSGPVLGLQPTADGVGLLVYLADRVNAILGGPETISFYATDFLTNFGISNPNALFRDGSILGQFTTQRQYFELVGKEKQEVGEHVADYLTDNFIASQTYATMHRDGLDVGMFLSNGVDQVLRFGTNINAWSVPEFPVCGAGALRSIETDVGVFSLMLATPSGGKTAMSVLTNPSVGVSISGTRPAWANPSNITLGNPTEYATVTFASPGTSQVLRASSYLNLNIPTTAVIQGVQLVITGYQSTMSNLKLQVSPTNPVAGATIYTTTLNVDVPTVLGGPSNLWGMPWNVPGDVNNGQLSFDLNAINTGTTPEMFVAEVQVVVTYQNPGNYLYARDVNSWGDCGGYGLNNGTPYDSCFITVGSITLSQLGAPLFPLQHVVGYFDSVGTLNNGGPSIPTVSILPNEISGASGIGFIELPQVVPEPPEGQNHASTTILALRWPVNMANSYLMSQFIHHLQVKIFFAPELAPNTLKGLAFKSEQVD